MVHKLTHGLHASCRRSAPDERARAKPARRLGTPGAAALGSTAREHECGNGPLHPASADWRYDAKRSCRLSCPLCDDSRLEWLESNPRSAGANASEARNEHGLLQQDADTTKRPPRGASRADGEARGDSQDGQEDSASCASDRQRRLRRPTLAEHEAAQARGRPILQDVRSTASQGCPRRAEVLRPRLQAESLARCASRRRRRPTHLAVHRSRRSSCTRSSSTSASGRAGRSFSTPTAATACRTRRATRSSAGSPSAPTSPPRRGSARTACATAFATELLAGGVPLHRQPPPAGRLRPLRRADERGGLGVLSPPLGVNGDKH